MGRSEELICFTVSQNLIISNPAIGTLGGEAGNLNLDGGSLTASGGRIELGSVTGNSTIGIQQTQADFELNYDNVEVFQDIKLLNSAVIDSSGNKGGGIQIQGNNIDIVDSFVLANSSGSGKGEDLIVNASEAINLISRNNFSYIQKLTLSSGDSGNLIIQTKNLTLQDGAFIDTSIGDQNNNTNLVTGKPADLIINASDSIDLIGVSQDVDSGLYSNVNSNAAHKGGSIQIETSTQALAQSPSLPNSIATEKELSTTETNLPVKKIEIYGSTVLQSEIIALINGGRFANLENAELVCRDQSNQKQSTCSIAVEVKPTGITLANLLALSGT